MQLQMQNSGLEDLLRILISEPFAVEHGFADMNLDEVGLLLENLQESFGKTESFEKCKSTYCLLLLELDLLHREIPTQALSELVQVSVPEKIEEEFPILEPITPPFKPTREDTVWSSFAAKAKAEPAKNFAALAEELKQWAPASMKVGETKRRLIAQSLCWAIEAELFRFLKPGLVDFWPVRNEPIHRHLNKTGSVFDLAPDLKTSLEGQSKEYGEWLYESRFPIQGLITSLRYLLSVPNLEKFNPAPLDLATLILLFSKQLKFTGLQEEETTEFVFRLSRLQGLKAKVFSPHQEWKEADLHLLEEDVSACAELLVKLHGEEGHLQSVA